MAGLQTSTRGTARDRDRGLARLNNLTRTAIVGATALAGVFAGVAAQSVKGRSATLAPSRVARRVVTPRQAPAPPTAPPVGAASAAPQQQAAPAPTPAPVPTPAPPVVVSGGS